jgi:hypothetical protein
MAKKDDNQNQMSMPILGMLLMGVLGALIVAAQTEVVKYWPMPCSIAPYFGPEVGFWWGLIVGGVAGLVVGFLVDEKHFNN